MFVLPLRNSRTEHALLLPSGQLEKRKGLKTGYPASGHLPIHATLPKRSITIGEVVAVAKPTMLKTLLGSCVAVCLRDPVTGVAGMNHILLPEGAKEEGRARFGVHAMELLINEMMKLGGDRRRFVAKAFGAGNVLPCLQSPTVGERNACFVRDFLALEGIRLIAQRLGGESAVEIRFRSDTGKVTVRSIDGAPLSAIAATEEDYRQAPAALQADDEITIF